MEESVIRNRQWCVRQCNIARTRSFLTMNFMSQLSLGAVKFFNLPPESQLPIWEIYGCHCT